MLLLKCAEPCLPSMSVSSRHLEGFLHVLSRHTVISVDAADLI